MAHLSYLLWLLAVTSACLSPVCAASTAVWLHRLHFTNRTQGHLQLIVDVASSGSFVVEQFCATCPFRGLNHRFNPKNSANFEWLADGFGARFEEPWNAKAGTVRGYLGQDFVVSLRPFQHLLGQIGGDPRLLMTSDSHNLGFSESD